MYLLDANILIDAKNRYYAFDIAPSYWEWLEHSFASGTVGSIQAVYGELVAGGDELGDWAKRHRKYFLPIDQRTTTFFQPLSDWARSQRFTQQALATFSANAADYLMVAFSATYKCTVVTHEIPDPKSRKRVKIPDACAALKVSYTDPWTMFRKTGSQLALRP